jgi:FtsZ-binding cell division protein ZapB
MGKKVGQKRIYSESESEVEFEFIKGLKETNDNLKIKNQCLEVENEELKVEIVSLKVENEELKKDVEFYQSVLKYSKVIIYGTLFTNIFILVGTTFVRR